MTNTIGPKIKPKKPISLKPMKIETKVANGSRPMLEDKIFGSMNCLWTITTVYKIPRPSAKPKLPIISA